MARNSLVGQVLGDRYRIDEILGQGGMSTVYKAFDPHLKRVVAIKVIHSHLAQDPRFLQRFQEEAAAIAALRHPNILHVFDFSHDDDLYYMVQEFIAGQTLQEHLRQLSKRGRRMPPADAIRCALDVCSAAGYAHEQGMIHRDIKPANIMLDRQGHAMLMDFGLVKMLEAERHTITGAVLGTALYMPPEIARGEPADARSDVYSLGVTLFEMVSGRVPFDGDSTMAVLLMHAKDPVPDLRTLRPDVPAELVAVIGRALAKERSARYPSMPAFAADLRRVAVSSAPAVAPSQTTVEEPAVRPVAPRPVSMADAASGSAGPAATPVAQVETPAAARRTGKATTFIEPDASAPPSEPVRGNPRRTLLWAAGAGLALLIVVGVVLAATRLGRGAPPTAASAANTAVVATLSKAVSCRAGPSDQYSAVAQLPVGQTLQVQGLSADESWWNVSQPEAAGATCWVPLDAAVATGDLSTLALVEPPPLPTGLPDAGASVELQAITLDQLGRYVVAYTVHGFTPGLPGTHLHFFFNNVPPDQVGISGGGLRRMSAGPAPFTGYALAERPANATKLCALVARPDHSVLAGSGNCVDLPAAPAGAATSAAPRAPAASDSGY